MKFDCFGHLAAPLPIGRESAHLVRSSREPGNLKVGPKAWEHLSASEQARRHDYSKGVEKR